jgi:uncharacterized membrane protein YvlD (DUF360 family)
MIRFLIRIAIFFGSALVALWVTDLILEDFTLGYPEGLIVAAVIYALLQAILAPLIFKVAAKNASALMGGVGLISTFVALWLTTIFTGDDGLNISGATAWLLGTLLVWLITAVAGWVLPLIFLKKAVDNN